LIDDERAIFATLEEAAPAWIGIDGYSPGGVTDTWLSARLLPRLRARQIPVVLTFAGTHLQLAGLAGAADEVHELEALDVQEITDHLLQASSRVKPPFGADEARRYAEIISSDPSQLSALTAVLAVVGGVAG
jgi:hypothetical protein